MYQMKLLNEILGTKYPIIQGGMANIATGEFAAACSNADEAQRRRHERRDPAREHPPLQGAHR